MTMPYNNEEATLQIYNCIVLVSWKAGRLVKSLPFKTDQQEKINKQNYLGI